jgi:hypothetical protein
MCGRGGSESRREKITEITERPTCSWEAANMNPGGKKQSRKTDERMGVKIMVKTNTSD